MKQFLDQKQIFENKIFVKTYFFENKCFKRVQIILIKINNQEQ